MLSRHDVIQTLYAVGPRCQRRVQVAIVGANGMNASASTSRGGRVTGSLQYANRGDWIVA